MARRALFGYAVAMLIAGIAWGWRAPLSWDEQQYYLPAAQFFAERLPHVPLDYPMPMPPFALIVQGILYRWTGSVAVLRMLSTLAMIGAVAVFATTGKSGDRSDKAWVVLMFGTFPAALLNAFTLKHHALVLLCCTAAFALWQRRRVVPAATLLAIAALTHQIAGAAVASLVVLSLLERRIRDAVIVAVAALPLAALVLLWGGTRPPMHHETFTSEPAVGGVQPAQILVLLFMAGVWIAPAVGVRLKVAALALPFTAIWMYAVGLMHPASVFERLAGPVSSLIAAATRGGALAAAIAAAVVAALGVALYFKKERAFGVWSAMYALLMLGVPYFFESYYALFVAIGWMLLRDRVAARPSWFPVAATLAGIGYVIVKA